jgi:ABC-type proline/glycine betaine transport system permease subunit
MNNSTIFTADRTTHLKIVVVSLVASIAIIVVGIAASRNTTTADTTARIQTAGPAVKAGKPIAITHSDTSTIR